MTKTRYVPFSPDEQLIQRFIAAALLEDAGSGDHTSVSTIPETAHERARLLVKDTGVLAGAELALYIFRQVDPALAVKKFITDGTYIQPGDIVLEAEGPARSILLAERLVLNCMQRMSGIATLTDRMVRKLDGLHTQLLDTRKTTPGFRYFEKWAVLTGGGGNHRFGLYDMILIKDNHVDYAGGIAQAIGRAKNYLAEKKLALDIEIEVRNFKELDEALAAGGIQRIMLDNFSIPDLLEAVKKIGGRYKTEASGGIGEQNLRAYAETGVDYISMGALTHSYRSLDLSLKAERK
ncbi:MAG: nicotinate-nucleotide pyrophosphorylase (carboxylating) [Bacteroidetes bacterium]|nr:MAG: nicotinate-nucleotide pyrophosphorylase (carboxylating) [Bacteroidota bacterium]